MKIMLRLIEREFKYLHYSKLIYTFILIIVAVNALSLWGNANMLKKQYNEYLEHIDRYRQLGYNVEELLKKEMHVKTENINGSLRVTTDNPLKYSQSEVAKYLFIVSPRYFTHNTLELITFLLGPMIFGIFGALYAFYDYKYKVVQVKAVNYRWKDWLIAKQITSILSILVILIVGLLVTEVITLLSNHLITRGIDPNLVVYTPLDLKTSIIVKTLVSVMCNSVFSMIGFFMVVLGRSVVVPTVAIVVYNTLIPMVGKYDLKNIFSNIGHEVFEFYSFTFRLVQPIEMNTSLAIALSLGIIACLGGINLLICKSQSKYLV